MPAEHGFHGLQCRPAAPLSPYKAEWGLEARVQECRRVTEKHPARVPMIIERGAGCDTSVPELPKSKLLMAKDLTIAQALRVIRAKAGLRRDCRLQLHVNGRQIDAHLVLEKVHAQEKDEDGFLYCNYSVEQPSSSRPGSAEGRDSGATEAWFSWAPTSSFSWSPSGGWKTTPAREEEGGGGHELHQIRCKKELKARSRFEKRMKHRAAGKRDSSPPEVSSNSKLAQALASCKLDTALSGLIEVATKTGSSGSSPGSCGSAYQCGMPCALRIHTVRPH